MSSRPTCPDCDASTWMGELDTKTVERDDIQGGDFEMGLCPECGYNFGQV